MTVGFAQRDARWAHECLGTSSLSLGEAGCLVSALASLLVDWGIETDPSRLNAWLRANGGFVGGNRVRFAALGGLGVQFVLLDDCYRHRAPVGRLRDALQHGQGAVGLIDTRPGQLSRAHWVRLAGFEGRECVVMDPWRAPGDELAGLLAEYGAPGWDVGRAVFAYAVYQQEVGGYCDGRAEQGAVCVRR